MTLAVLQARDQLVDLRRCGVLDRRLHALHLAGQLCAAGVRILQLRPDALLPRLQPICCALREKQAVSAVWQLYGQAQLHWRCAAATCIQVARAHMRHLQPYQLAFSKALYSFNKECGCTLAHPALQH